MDELRSRIKTVEEYVKRNYSEKESLKILMITHKVLATQQGYERLLEVLGDDLKDKQDIFLLFFMETVEPIFKALKTSDMQLLFETLSVKRYPIARKADKSRWKHLEQALEIERSKKGIDVLKTVIESKLVLIPPQIEAYYQMYKETPSEIYTKEVSIGEFLNLEYEQFLAAIDFLYPEADFSTEHEVKGEEYDNVVFVIGKGWNQYQFETYMPMIKNDVPIPKGKEKSFVRNRNLFYVCCSRPKKRLIFFVTIPMSKSFCAFMSELVGADNIITYTQWKDSFS